MSSRQRLVNISCFIVWCGYAFVQTVLLWWDGFDLELIISDSLTSATVLSVSCFIISNALNHYLPSRRHYFYVVVWALVLAAAGLTASRWLMPITIDDLVYLDMVNNTGPVRFWFSALIIAWMATINILWNIQLDQQENEQRKSDAERLAREAELYNLRQQLQPHFLFNSLNSIIALINRQPQKAKEMTFQLSDFLRGTLRKDDQQYIALNEELTHLKLYLDIEKVRFGHRLATIIDGEEACTHCILPAMIIQPLVENAIKFGLYDTTDDVIIEIRASFERNDQLLILTVRNPYDAQRKAPRKGTGFGLSGVQRRLFLLYGRTDLLDTEGTDGIFTCTIRIPQPEI